jgi:quercetin dioxygenase-like cupin family protein
MPASNDQPATLSPGAEPTFWVLDLPGRAKARAQQTGGIFGLVEAECPPGYATPLHIHYLEDEALYVLDGRLEVFVGGAWLEAGAGCYLNQPRGIAHGLRVAGAAPARVLFLTVPAGADQGQPGPDSAPCPLGPAALELEQLADLVARYKIEVLGPLPNWDPAARPSALA